MTPVTIDMFLFPEIILFLNKLNKDILCIRKQTTFNTLLFTFYITPDIKIVLQCEFNATSHLQRVIVSFEFDVLFI